MIATFFVRGRTANLVLLSALSGIMAAGFLMP
jgi:hypothetical protein